MSKTDDFIDYLFKSFHGNKALRSDFRRADNDAFEWKVWPVISHFADVRKRDECRLFALVGSAIAKSAQEVNGQTGLGSALRQVSTGMEESKDFSARFKRILAIDSIDDLVVVMRPTLAFISSKGINLDYKKLMKEFHDYQYENSRDRIRRTWALDYLDMERADE